MYMLDTNIIIFSIRHPDSQCARKIAEHTLRENSDRDKMIAAHARSLGYTLVTNNTKDFICIPGLRLEDWRVPGDL